VAAWARILAALLMLGLGSAAAQVPPESHLQRASRLILQDHLSEACAELFAAYQESLDPVLLLRIGRLQQRLGQKEAAADAFTRFLREAPTAHPGLKAEAEDALRALSPPPPPPPAIDLLPPPLPPPPQVQVDGLTTPFALPPAPPAGPRRNRRLMKIGALLFGAGYLPALVIPLALSGSLDQPNAPSPASNYTVMIPLFGPLVTGIVAPATDPGGHAGQLISSWSVPWILTSGVLQATGFTLFVIGAIPRSNR
jgi:hypothetical protein